LDTQLTTVDVTLEPEDNQRLARLCGPFNENLKQLEKHYRVAINNRGNLVNIKGTEAAAKAAAHVLQKLYLSDENEPLSAEMVHLYMHETKLDPTNSDQIKPVNLAEHDEASVIHTRRKMIKVRNPNQLAYVKSMDDNDIVFGIGPAGTGKTYLAVARAVQALESEQVSRIILARPAVEAGERLGFLPGDLSDKINPYLRPLYDALYEMLGVERVSKLIEKNIIEIAPLAFMRGRTLSEAFIILDEAQNTTPEQIKMFLTRIGFGSSVVVTGDVTQVDLPSNVDSGLRLMRTVLKGIDGISFTEFKASDVVRHPIVQKIVTAYEKYDTRR